jgi:hypothetical protein
MPTGFTRQQYFSLRTNQQQPSATSQMNRLITTTTRDKLRLKKALPARVKISVEHTHQRLQ